MIGVSDDDLFQRYLNGDPDSFKAIYDRYAGAVWLLAQKTTRNKHSADDVLQNTFSALHVKKHSYKLGTNFRAWLFTLARDNSALWMRQRYRSDSSQEQIPETLFSDDTVGLEIEQKESQEEVSKVVSCLLPSYRNLLQMYFFDGNGFDRMAALMDIPVGTVKSRLHTAMVAFKKAWLAKHLD